ncbi:MAG: UvrD-helicase domain-containing protein [archaeon]
MDIEEIKRDENYDYIKILKALMELPFQVGRVLLADFLNGNYKNKSITNNCLDELYNFDTLGWHKDKIFTEIDRLIQNGMIEQVPSDYNQFIKILRLTIKGVNEVTNPTLNDKLLKNKVEYSETKISEEEKEIFKELNSFLDYYNDSQKKAIISSTEKILCVAGAGSGKTTVLTKRIEFLVKYQNVNSEKILAITFTRKAKQEMERRLLELGVLGVNVHTFNSFCEKILKKHEGLIYGRKINVQSYSDKILAMNMALASMGIDMQEAINRYFTPAQRRFKTGNQLANSFMNDCFSVLDYFKVTGQKEFDFSVSASIKDKNNARMIYQIVKYLKEHMFIQGLRDFSDQLIDAVKFLDENRGEIPQFSHVLVDEYQDVNAKQIELLNLLNPKNFFAVGDPRQSIFGWRGSDINYIINFEKNFPGSEVIHLTKNYRSEKEIVDVMNHSIKEMELPDLESHFDNGNSKIELLDFENEEAERIFVINNILNSDVSRNEIFVLARTNRQLLELSQQLKRKNISHVLRTDEVRSPADDNESSVTLATIHAIKGLEAKKVFVIGCNEQNFPCKASDHPAVEMVKTDEYDKLEEEKRLFYVAISRAKEMLYMTYSGKKPTHFINEEMIRLARGEVGGRVSVFDEEKVDLDVDKNVREKLKVWRLGLSREREVPAFTILTDKTLEEIASKLPDSPEKLLKINGFGPVKLMSFGESILKIIGGNISN